MPGSRCADHRGHLAGYTPLPDDPRIVIKLVNGADGALHGVLFQLDKLPSSVALSVVTFALPDAIIAQLELGVTFQGQLSPDGKLTSGTWTQDKRTYPITLVLATPETLLR